MVYKSHILSVCVQAAGVFRLQVSEDFASFLFYFFLFVLFSRSPFYLDCVEKQVKGTQCHSNARSVSHATSWYQLFFSSFL